MKKWARLVILFIGLIGWTSCNDVHMVGESTPIGNRAKAADSNLRDFALVNLVFPTAEAASRLEVTNRLNGTSVPFTAAQGALGLIVTLRLQKGVISNPRLRAFGDGISWSFTALVTPEQSVSTFTDLYPADHTVVLRDYGQEKEVQVGEAVVFDPVEYTPQVVNGELHSAARARFLKPDAGPFAVQSGGSVFQVATDALTEAQKLEGSTGTCGLVIVPADEAEPADLKITRP